MLTPTEFAREARDWLSVNTPDDLPFACDSHEAVNRMMEWEGRLHAAGYRAISWPVEHGGRGLPETFEWAFQDEYERAVGSTRVDQVSQRIVAPALMRVCSRAQLQRWLPPIAACTELWALGLSEAGAGSDLKNVATRAEAVPGGFVLNGTKVWTSGAQYATWMFTLVRTPPTAEAGPGLSVMAVDLRAEGLRIEPIPQIHGQREFCEVQLQDVFVPDDCLIGEPGDGWRLVRILLDFERGMISSGVKLGEQLDILRRLVLELPAAGPAANRAPIALLEARLFAYRSLVDTLRRCIAQDVPLGAWSSVGKLGWSQLGVDIHESLLAAMAQLDSTALAATTEHGRDVSPASVERWPEFEYEYWQSRAGLIYGGALEIQLEIIANQLLK